MKFLEHGILGVDCCPVKFMAFKLTYYSTTQSTCTYLPSQYLWQTGIPSQNEVKHEIKKYFVCHHKTGHV